jgi:O-antigen ligase
MAHKPNKQRQRLLRHLDHQHKEPRWFHFLPLLLVLGLTPLVVRARVTELSEMERFIFNGASFHVDFFHYYKSVVFTWLSVIALAVLLYLHYYGIRTIQKTRWHIPLAIYGVAVFLSFLNSDDFTVGLRGFATSYQGLGVYVSYGIVVFVIMHMVKTRRDIEYFIWPMWIMGLLLSIISLSQFLGGSQFAEHPYFGPIQDIFRYEWMQNFILPQALRETSEGINIGGRVGRIYATTYNSNFVGSLATMLIFLGVSYFLFVKRWWQRLGMLVFIASMVIILVGADSRAGFAGFVSATGVFVLLLAPRLYKLNPLYLLALVVVTFGGLFLGNEATNGRFQERLESILDFPDRNERPQIYRLDINEFEVIIETEVGSIVAWWEPNQMFFSDLEGNPIAYNLDTNRFIFTFDDPDLETFSFHFDAENGRLRTRFHGHLVDFMFFESGFHVNGVGGLAPFTQSPPRLEFLRGYERVFSSRGYIYSVSTPLLKDTWLIGAGTDHYVFALPQRDLAGRLVGFGRTTVLDKPHNMFLQFGIEIGVVGLIALLSLTLYPLITLVKAPFSSAPEALWRLGLFSGLIGMYVSGLANDLILSIAPVFFVLYGLACTDLTHPKEKPSLEG